MATPSRSQGRIPIRNHSRIYKDCNQGGPNTRHARSSLRAPHSIHGHSSRRSVLHQRNRSLRCGNFLRYRETLLQHHEIPLRLRDHHRAGQKQTLVPIQARHTRQQRKRLLSRRIFSFELPPLARFAACPRQGCKKPRRRYCAQGSRGSTVKSDIVLRSVKRSRLIDPLRVNDDNCQWQEVGHDPRPTHCPLNALRGMLPPGLNTVGEEICEQESERRFIEFRVSTPYLDSRISRPFVGWMGRAFIG